MNLLNLPKFQQVAHFLKWKRAESHASNPAYYGTPRQSQQESDRLSPLAANASHLDDRDNSNKSPDNLHSADVLINASESKTYLCEYRYQGCTWSFEIIAESYEDAQARIRSLAYGKVLGEVKGTVSYELGWVAKALVFFANTWRDLVQLVSTPSR